MDAAAYSSIPMKSQSSRDESRHVFDALIDLGEDKNSAIIPAELLKQAILSSDAVLNGLAFSMMHSPNIYERVEPQLRIDDFQDLHIKYLSQCIRNASAPEPQLDSDEEEWIDPPYFAAYSVAVWFAHLWEDRRTNRLRIARWKQEFELLAKDGESKVQRHLITGVFKKIFMNDEISAYFNDWLKDRELSEIYLAGIYAAGSDGSSPLRWDDDSKGLV